MADRQASSNATTSKDEQKAAADKLKAIRSEIDRLDSAIVELIKQRIQLLGKVVEIKEKEELPTLDVDREKDVIEKVCAGIADAKTASLVKALYIRLFELSREYQAALRQPLKESDKHL